MVMNTLKRTELIAIRIRDEIFACLNKSSKTRTDLVTSGAMTRTDSLKIAEYEESLQKLADELNFLLLPVVVADIEEAADKIKTATSNVNKAIDELKALNDFIGILAAVISMVSTIIVAFNTGNPLKLADLLDQIEVLAA